MLVQTNQDKEQGKVGAMHKLQLMNFHMSLIFFSLSAELEKNFDFAVYMM